MIYYPFFKIGLILGAIPARLGWDSVIKHFMRLNAGVVISLRRAMPKQDMLEVGREWKRMFPLSGMQEIISADADTVYAEAYTWCPLRNSGDVRACYKMMEFDRKLLEKIGGQLVVLQSQAEHGVKVCRIAIRRPGKSVNDLIPAHVRNTKGFYQA